MNRWWADPRDAFSTLECVDSSDPVQGVGTAVLGYHGLSEGVLRPLTEQTLVDVSTVSKALESLDLAPVAKALANATRPVVGDAAERYGELLARDLHDRAVESTGRLILNLVSTGMAWPTAIDRAASVHGVPVERLGKAGSVLRAPALAKIAQADVADRVLMEYASHVGNREYTPEVVAKAQQREREFKEELVNRDAMGRFSDKPERSLAGLGAEAKQDFLERQARRQRRKKKQNNRAEQTQVSDLAAALMARDSEAKNKPLTMLAWEAKTSPKDALDAEFDALQDKLIENMRDKEIEKMRQRAIDKAIDALANRKALTDDDFESIPDLLEVPDDILLNGDYYPGWVGGSRDGILFALVDKRALKEAVEVGGFNWAKLVETGAVYTLEPLDKEQMQQAVLGFSAKFGEGEPLNDVAVLAFDGLVAYDEDFTAGDKTYLAEAGVYKTSTRNKVTGQKGLEFDDYLDLELKGYSTPGINSGPRVPITLPHMTVVLENDKDFRNLPGNDFTKSDRWDENEVVRDALGRFAEEGQNTGAVLRDENAERRARMERRKRRQKKQGQQAQGQTNDLVAALQARDAQQSTQSDARRQDRSLSLAEMKNDVAQDRIFDDMQEQLIERLRQRELDKALAKVTQRQKRLVSFKDTHEEWRGLKAMKFANDGDMGTFTEIFDFDPYTGKSLELGGVTDAAQRMDTIDFVMDRLKDSQAVVEGMFYNSRNPMVGVPIPAGELGTARWGNIAETPWKGFLEAQAAAEEMNKASNDATREWMPMVRFDDEHREFPMYRPFIVEVVKLDEDVVVLGSDAEWAALRRGDKVALEPLTGYNDDPDQPGQGTIKELFYAVGSEESVGHDSELHDRSDFYVRAFRIKT